MPGPRSDFSCPACGEMYELPVGATACPVCQGALTRVWAANVGRGLAPYIDRLTQNLSRRPTLSTPPPEPPEALKINLPTETAGLIQRMRADNERMKMVGGSTYRFTASPHSSLPLPKGARPSGPNESPMEALRRLRPGPGSVYDKTSLPKDTPGVKPA